MTENSYEKEVSFEGMVERTLLKYRRLFPKPPLFYRGAEVVNYRTHETGMVDSMSMDTLTIVHSDGRQTTVPVGDVFSAETYWGIATSVTLAAISYKGKETPAVLVSEGTFILPCPKIFEDFKNILAIPDRSRLRGISQERYYEHFRKFLRKISWNDMVPEDIDALTDEDVDVMVYGVKSEDEVTGREITLPPAITLDGVIERILDVYKITPCDTCTMPNTCDCRMRLVQQVKGDKASSYRVAQHTIRGAAELMSFLLKGIFRGRPRIRFIDYDVWLKERLADNYDPKWIEVTRRAIQIYEDWAGKPVSAEVTATLDDTANMIGMDNVEELELEPTVQE